MRFAAILLSAMVLNTEAIKLDAMPVEDELAQTFEELDAEVEGVFRCGYAKIAQGGRPVKCKVSEHGRPFGGSFDCSRICHNGNIMKNCGAYAKKVLGC